ncbi:acyltransferase family protein [Promicromonospora sp. NPDC059942]|uniref:acyltransferase family protein n=1 Tax=Promicromonospora sp. NPDC059942 TaxID=3347009 RepID=UPI0036669FAD
MSSTRHDPGPDQLKGILMVLVIFGHTFWQGVGDSWTKWMIYGFHMPMFLFLSGYMISMARFGTRPWGELLRHYWKRMIAAWLVVSVLWLAVQEPDAFGSVRSFVEVLVLRPSFHLWYVPMLFLSVLLLRLLGGPLARSVVARAALGVAAVAGALLFQTPLKELVPQVVLDNVDARYAGYFVWILLGVAVRNGWFPRLGLVWVLPVVAVGLVARSWVYTSDGAGPWWSVAAFTVLSLGASLCVPALRDALRTPLPIVGESLRTVGHHSLYVYLLHPFVTDALHTPEVGWLRSMALGGAVTVAILVASCVVAGVLERVGARRRRFARPAQPAGS